ncbi:putative efflux protein, MATE family [Monaibacterium marinum]|uniref:Putative efflux protein, MATE family n=1 Tax=Pontivivens marinum TaxID=1690039 RepID=A0A2C9CVG9_9RHOB|nr:MATE family efflux transporter [Monaibacterium marinum]SOH95258.1 putative efflux protein, MATE family [Monaibacterium marinum]
MSATPSTATPPAAGPASLDVFALAWPMTLKAIILHGTVVIDAYLVSALGETALAAMGLAAAVAGFVLGAILAFSNAMQLRTAQAFGTGDPVFIKSALACGMAISLTVGCVGLAIISLFGGSLIGVMAPTQQVADLAIDYLTVFSLVIVGEAIGQCLSSYFNGCGRTRLPLYSFCLSLPINVITSIVLIHGYFGLPAFGVTGAAMGSAIAVTVQVGFLVVRLWALDGYLRHVAGWRQLSFVATLRRHLAFALPIAVTFFSATFASHVCTLIYARLNLNEFAAMTIIAPWIMVAGTIGMQWAQATGIIVAQLLGQGQREEILDRFLRSAWRGAFVAAGVVAVIFLIVCLSASYLYADLDVETRTVLLSFLPILLVLPFPKGSNAICGNTLRASGDTIYVMHIFVWSQWLFRVPATALAVLYFDVSVFWVLSLLFFEELLKFPVFHRRLLRGDWKRAKIAN